MVCAKCQKLSKSTALATPGVKKKSEMYFGSPAGSSKSGDKTKTSATLGNNGIGKVGPHSFHIDDHRLSVLYRVNCYQNPPKIPTLPTRAHAQHAKRRLNKAGPTARNAHTRQMVCSHLYLSLITCMTDLFLACPMCGKANSKSTAAAPVIAGQKFTLK
jgi:hypothetical protein